MRRLAALTIISMLLVLDQHIKHFVEEALTLGQTDGLFGGILLSYTRSNGILGSIFGTDSPWIIKGIVIGLILIGGLFMLLEKPASWMFSVGIAMSVAGLGSNLIDRVVSDDNAILVYLDFTRLSSQIPIFNLADLFVVIGLIIAAIAIVKAFFKRGKESKAASAPVQPKPFMGPSSAPSRSKGGFVIGDMVDNSFPKKPDVMPPPPITISAEQEPEDVLIDEFDRRLAEREAAQKGVLHGLPPQEQLPTVPAPPPIEDIMPQMPMQPTFANEQAPASPPQNNFDFYAGTNPAGSATPQPDPIYGANPPTQPDFATQQPQDFNQPAPTPSLMQNYNQFMQSQNQPPQPQPQANFDQQNGFNQGVPMPMQGQPQNPAPNSDAEFLARARANAQRLSAQLNSSGAMPQMNQQMNQPMNQPQQMQPPQPQHGQNINNSTQDALNRVNHLLRNTNNTMNEQANNVNQINADSESYKQKLAEIQRKYRQRLENQDDPYQQ